MIGNPGFASAGAGHRLAAAQDGDVVIGWDIGGAHVKACLLQHGRVHDVAQWACPLWQGLDRLDAALRRAALRWPDAVSAQHAVTMTGEMVDLFEDREDGVRRIAETLLRHWPAARVRFFAGAARSEEPAVAAWCDPDGVAAHWSRIASANWLATALHIASTVGSRAGDRDGDGSGLLVDIGSTTTDIVAFGGGRVLSSAGSDTQRLASGELVYHGVVRTPLCALAATIAFQGSERNVMNELFATTADVYRLTGELNADHDLHPAADNAGKDALGTQRRLARMIGLDARDAAAADWLGLAQGWRAKQLAVLRDNLLRVAAAHRLSPRAIVVSAGCGHFLANELAAALPTVDHESSSRAATRGGLRCVRYGDRVASAAAGGLAARAQLCAPSVAVAMLWCERDRSQAPRRADDGTARRPEAR